LKHAGQLPGGAQQFELGLLEPDISAAVQKAAREVVDAVVGAGLARVEYTLWPLASLKGTEGGGRRGKRFRKSGKHH